MANQYILGQIANPQVADIAGALDFRAKRMAEDEKRRKDEKFRQVAGQALSSGLREGSILHELAMNDPERYIMVAKVMGIDPANGAEGTSILDDINEIYAHTTVSPENGLGYVQSLIDSRSKLGLDTSRFQQMVENGRKDPQFFKGMVTQLQNTFNPNMAGQRDSIGTYNPRDYTTESWGEFIKTRDPSVLKRYESSQIVDIGGVKTIVDKTTGERTPVTSLEEVESNVSTIAGSETKAKEDAKDLSKYKSTLFDSINSNSRLLSKYRFAIRQLDEGAETGPIINRLPNLKEQSILVDVVRKEIGMEILGSGLLGVNPTDRDVDFALTTAIPDNLRPDALKRELERRSRILEEINAAQDEYFQLIDQGYTKADILRLARERKNQQGGSGEGANTPGITGKTEPSEDYLARRKRLLGM